MDFFGNSDIGEFFYGSVSGFFEGFFEGVVVRLVG